MPNSQGRVVVGRRRRADVVSNGGVLHLPTRLLRFLRAPLAATSSTTLKRFWGAAGRLSLRDVGLNGTDDPEANADAIHHSWRGMDVNGAPASRVTPDTPRRRALGQPTPAN